MSPGRCARDGTCRPFLFWLKVASFANVFPTDFEPQDRVSVSTQLCGILVSCRFVRVGIHAVAIVVAVLIDGFAWRLC